MGTRSNHSGLPIMENNLYYGSGVHSEASVQYGFDGLLSDPDGGYFFLTTSTDPGVSLVNPYDVDALQVIRGADTIWDRGAYEFAPENFTIPNSPDNLRFGTN